MEKLAAVAIHDVAPKNLKKVIKLRDFLQKQGIGDFTYLVIPCLRSRKAQDIRNNPSFVDFLNTDSRDIQLHGMTHFNLFLEDEFSGISYRKAYEKLSQGREAFRECFGGYPKGFIPPMWMLNKNTLKAAQELGFGWTSSRTEFRDLQCNKRRRTVIAIRGGILTIPSALNSVLRGRKEMPVQIALHPKDNFLKLRLMKQIIGVLRKRGYKFVDYSEFADSICGRT